MSSSAKGKGRAVDSDNSDQEQDPGSDSGHQRPSSTSQPTNKSKSKSQLRAALDEEGEVRPTLAEHLDNEANWTPEEKAKRERKTRADYRKLQLEIEGKSKRVGNGPRLGSDWCGDGWLRGASSDLPTADSTTTSLNRPFGVVLVGVCRQTDLLFTLLLCAGDRHNLIDTTVDQLGARVAAANKLFKTGKSATNASAGRHGLSHHH